MIGVGARAGAGAGAINMIKETRWNTVKDVEKDWVGIINQDIVFGVGIKEIRWPTIINN